MLSILLICMKTFNNKLGNDVKIAYLTRAAVPSKVAQSVQIHSMAIAFNQHLGDNFCLITPETQENRSLVNSFTWFRISANYNSKFFYINFAIYSLYLAKRWGANIIFTRDIGIAFLGAIIGIRSTYEVHKEPRGKLALILFYLTSRMNRIKLVAISEALSYYYQINFKISSEKILTAHDGVFLDKYDFFRNEKKSYLRDKLGLPQNVKIVMHTGSLYPGRGAELFLTLLQNFPEILFVHVGGLSIDIERWRKKYINFKNIIFFPHVENNYLIQYQMSADLLFFPMTKLTPTWWCCSPMKIFEYMATGIPILTVNIGSTNEVLTDNNSIKFDPENSDSLIDGLKLFLKDENMAKKKANLALDQVKKNYTWENRAFYISEFIIEHNLAEGTN